MNGFASIRKRVEKLLKGRSPTDFFVMLLIGVLVLVVAVPTGNGGAKEKAAETEEPAAQKEEYDREKYVKRLEQELAELLESMAGVGKCRVMLTLEDDGVTCVDKNVRSEETRREESTVIYSAAGSDAPYVIRKKSPRVAGVVVVAQGGGDAVVSTNILNAVMSLFQLEAHKITVVKMSVQED